jgi:hypothetical protein
MSNFTKPIIFRAKVPYSSGDFITPDFINNFINKFHIQVEINDKFIICKSNDINNLQDSCKFLIQSFKTKLTTKDTTKDTTKETKGTQVLSNKEVSYKDLLVSNSLLEKKETKGSQVLSNKVVSNSLLEKKETKGSLLEKKLQVTNKVITNKVQPIKEKKEKMIKEDMKVHPEILKMGFMYQMIGNKASNIKEINNKVANDCYIRCNEEEGVYEISCRSKRGINMARDLLECKEREILTSPLNVERLSKVRDGFIYYRYGMNGISYLYKKGNNFIDMKGKKCDYAYGEIVSRRSSIIEYNKKLQDIRYEISKEENKEVKEIDEERVKDIYEERYNKNIEKGIINNNKEEIIEEFKKMPASPVSDNKHWNKDKIEDIKKVLPLVIKSNKKEKKNVEIDESIYMECCDIDISELLEMEEEKLDLSIEDMIEDEDLEDIEIEDIEQEARVLDAWD